MSFWVVLGHAAAIVALYLACGWLLSMRLHDVSIVDVMWGPGFALVAAVGALLGAGDAARKLLVLLLVVLWSLRLAIHIFLRNYPSHGGQGEDYRYRAMRQKQGPRFAWLSAFTVFGLQGVLLLVIAMPLVAATSLAGRPAAAGRGAAGLGPFDFAGLALFAIGFLFEAVGDAQLARFKAKPANRGKVCDVGLWRYSRHPNYFGDATLWWGLFLVACAVPGGWRTIGSPLVMTVLLLKVSGVALLERGLTSTKPGYADYIARTSAFVPWLPRQARSGQRRLG
jgi:steroid 5-alpha reductase family enzyme